MDVLLLADVFETFRNTSMQHYGIDSANYFSAPGMSWDTLLKKTKVQLEQLTDVNMHLFTEKDMRLHDIKGLQRPTIHSVQIMTAQNRTAGSCIWMRIVSMAGP